MSKVHIETWRDEHGVTWELVQLGLDEIGGSCLVRECVSSLDVADGDIREGVDVIARFGDPEAARDYLYSEGFEPV